MRNLLVFKDLRYKVTVDWLAGTYETAAIFCARRNGEQTEGEFKPAAEKRPNPGGRRGSCGGGVVEVTKLY